MLTTARILGILAGLFGLCIGLFGYAIAGAAGVIAGQALSIAIPVASLVGGALAKERPILASSLMLLSAAGMLFLFGFNLFTAVPIVLAALGGLFALMRSEEAHRPPLRTVCRFLGYTFVGIALVVILYEIHQIVSGEPLFFAKLGEFWYRRYPTSLQLLQPALERHVAVWLWDPVMLEILTSPTWLVITGVAALAGALGAMLIFAGRNDKQVVGGELK